MDMNHTSNHVKRRAHKTLFGSANPFLTEEKSQAVEERLAGD